MKRVAFIAAFVLSAPSAAWSQGNAPAKPAAKPAAKTEAKTKAVVAHKSRRNEDARHCLERPSNTEIIKCAEEYL